MLIPKRTVPALLVLLAAACGDASAPETGGRYLATLASPNGQLDAAAVIELTGNGIDTVTAADAAQVFVQRSGSTMRVVVVKDVPGSIQFAVQLAKGSRIPEATVVEVADGGDQVRTSLTGYRVRIEK